MSPQLSRLLVTANQRAASHNPDFTGLGKLVPAGDQQHIACLNQQPNQKNQ